MKGFSIKLKDILKEAGILAFDNDSEYITTEHIFYSLLSNSSIEEIFVSNNVSIEELKGNLLEYILNYSNNQVSINKPQINYTYLYPSIITGANASASQRRSSTLCPIDILHSIRSNPSSFSYSLMIQYGITINKIKVSYLNNLLKEEKKHSKKNEEAEILKNPNELKGVELLLENLEEKKANKNKDLSSYFRNMYEDLEDKKFDGVINREEELKRIEEILLRRKKNNPILIGEPGVGKTTLIEGLAYKIGQGQVSKNLQGKKIYELNTSSLVSGTKYRGEFEERVKNLLEYIKEKGDIIIFIDEIHTILGAGSSEKSSNDLSNILKPYLTSGEITCIGSTTYRDYRVTFEKDKALERRFSKIKIKEPSVEDTIEILNGIKESYEKYHNIYFSSSIIEDIVNLSSIYLNDKALPDSAIDLLDEIGSKISYEKKERKIKVTKKMVTQKVSEMANLPELKTGRKEVAILKKLESKLSEKILGQEKAISLISKEIRKKKIGLRDKKKPLSSFLFMGATGVGKTETTKILSQILNMNYIRLDMSEYIESSAVSKLIGSNPGYIGYEEGGGLVERIKKHPYSIIVFDEIEKADSKVLNILLQMLEEGCLTDSSGYTTSLSNTIIIMTTNIGFSNQKSEMSFLNKKEEKNNFKSIEKAFKPELINRINKKIIFANIKEDIVKKVIEEEIKEINLKLEEAKQIKLSLTNKAKLILQSKIKINKYGFRDIKRKIEETISEEISDYIMFNDIKQQAIVLDAVEDNFIIKKGEVLTSPFK
jgi:ATP-dependent Clp protease ATP-binding subunit ClpA